MRHKTRVFDQVRDWLADGQSVVLAVVVDTAGSTYSKSGDFIALTMDGRYQGLVSGGCLEGDLAERARLVCESGKRQLARYDLSGEHDAIWGMGAGCDGEIEVLLVPLRGAALNVFTNVADRYRDGACTAFAFGFDSGEASSAAPSNEVETDPAIQQLLAATLAGRTSRCVEVAGQRYTTVYVNPAPRVLLLGAAPDSHPVCESLALLGWQVTVYDHRPAYIADMPEGPVAIAGDYRALARELPLEQFQLAMVMSHHLDADRAYLESLAACDHWLYIGLLGPVHRRQRLLRELGGEVARRLEPVLDGPAGLDIGAREPAAIALSIAAGMHTALAGVNRV